MTVIDVPAVLPANDAARFLGLSPSTLAKLRLSGNGPTYCKRVGASCTVRKTSPPG